MAGVHVEQDTLAGLPCEVFHMLAGVWPEAIDALDDFADRLTKAAT